jgi:para-aminobenzoate synthetase component 1
MAVGLYDWMVSVDHGRKKAWLRARNRDPATREKFDTVDALLSKASLDGGKPFRATGPTIPSLDRAGYGAGFKKIQQYIHDGDCYQVNFALRFDVPVEGDPWQGYLAIRNRNPTPFGAYLQLDDVTVLSFSPERFLRVVDGRVETRPVKGTRPRGSSPPEDQALRAELLDSAKDRAENLMIVDLLRNDLGRVCVPGSIGVDRLFEIETFATVHHLVSTISGELRDSEDALSLMRASFPGGSITGAPKIRAMEIIESLEPARRGVYCGAIGYIGYNGDMDTNIAIRTLVTRENRAWFWAGGGIVADSEEAAEYQECRDKAGFFLEFFNKT